jgi:outer membrane receptor protein involved in Fe transport
MVFLGGLVAFGQESATLTVTVFDQSAALVPGAALVLTDLRRGIVTQAETNGNGFVVFDFLQPGEYSLDASKAGFDKYHLNQLTLNVRDRQIFRIDLHVTAAAGASVQVTAKAETVSSEAAQGVSVNNTYLENLPVNGRNADSLILMAPGITSAAGGKGDGGFNANGLRSNTNYYTLDGVSTNSPPSGAGGFGGGGGGFGFGAGPAAIPGAGSPTDMISIDALQEMKVQTSSFAPEFGRSPGAQVVMTSRGGTNNLHGALYDYVRNNAFDANDWFANAGGYPKAEERQERPGGVLGGPIIENKTFFFVAFEKLTLHSPQSIVADVPDVASREAAPAALQPFINAFPLPNSVELGNGAAEYRAVISNPSGSDTASARIDHILNPSTTLFARFSLTWSNSQQRGSDSTTPNIVQSQSTHSDAITTGATHMFGGDLLNDVRVNYSRSSAGGFTTMDSYGGATPLPGSLVFPTGFTSADASFNLSILGFAGYSLGGHTANTQQQVNIVDSLSKVRGKHNLKAGVDYREILQTNGRLPFTESASFNGVTGNDQAFLTGVALNAQAASNLTTVYPTYRNFSLYGQDTWRATDRTTVTYGLRWDVNPAPTAREGPAPFALSNSTVAGVTQNQPLYPTTWLNVAPRIGVAYLSDDKPGHEMTLRAGAGLFYDTGYGSIESAFNGAPYSSVYTYSDANFPLTPFELGPPTLPPTRPYGQITTGDPGLSAPMVYQWDGTWEKNYGAGQTLAVSFVGTKGSNLLRTETTPTFSGAYSILREVTNGAESIYNGLQVQFRRRLSASFQTQISYTWSHSIDTASTDSGFGGGFASLFTTGERGSSDFDVRHSANFSGSWRLPAPANGLIFYPLRHWYLDFLGTARSGLPFDIQGVSSTTSNSTSSSSSSTTNPGLFANVRPDWNGLPIWISDPKVPGGRRLNPAAFFIPTGYQQGNLGRNSFRGFSLNQLDLAVRRMIPLTERFKLNLAAEGYNVLNHPNFANPTPLEGGNLSSPDFGIMTRMVNQAFGGSANALYRTGGPRSMEFSLRLQF